MISIIIPYVLLLVLLSVSSYFWSKYESLKDANKLHAEFDRIDRALILMQSKLKNTHTKMGDDLFNYDTFTTTQTDVQPSFPLSAIEEKSNPIDYRTYRNKRSRGEI